MVPAPVETDEKSAENTKDEIATVLIHMKKLLRLKNWLCSPLLRLPTEIIVQILSYITENRGEWQSVFSTCYHIRAVMNNAAELWQQANFVSDKRALPVSVFARSQGNLQEITADLIAWGDCRDDHARNALRFCRDNLVLHGHKLRALDLRGCPSDIINFSWIFERPLPRLEYLKIHFYPLWLKESGSYIQDPEILQFPADLPLRVLDLSNATPPWSSYLLFTELRELHLDFTECESFVEISEEELLGILEASPRLESLSLIRLLPKAPIVDGERDYNPIRIVKLASLTSLDLDSLAELVGYILVHMDVPVIDSLKIRGEFSPWEVEVFFGYLFPDFLLPERLLTNPPIFEIWPDGGYGIYDSLKVKIGGIHIQFDFDMDDEEEASETIIGCVLPLPPTGSTICHRAQTRPFGLGQRRVGGIFPVTHRSAFNHVVIFGGWVQNAPIRTVVGRLITCRSGCGHLVSKTRVDLAPQRADIHTLVQLSLESEIRRVRAQAPRVAGCG